MTALSICRSFAVASSDNDNSPEEGLELRDLFTSRADNVLKPLIRYCQYELRDAGCDPTEIQSLLSSGEVPADDGTNTQAEEGDIVFRNCTIRIENKSLRVLLLKIDGLAIDYYKSLGKGDAESTAAAVAEQKIDEKFMLLLSSYDDAIVMVEKDVKKYSNMKSGPAVNLKRYEVNNLLGYVKYEKLKLLMKRDEGLVNKLIKEAEEEEVEGQSSTNDDDDGDNDNRIVIISDIKYLEEISHLYDTLLQDARSVCSLPGGSSSSNDVGEGGEDTQEEDDEFILEANANILRIRALRCYYIGLLYASAIGLPQPPHTSSTSETANSGHSTRALTLLNHSLLLSSRATEEIAACDYHDNDNSNIGEEYINGMEELSMKINLVTIRLKAAIYILKHGGGSISNYHGNAINNKNKALLDRLNSSSIPTNVSSLVDVPYPSMIPMPCKPTFFDIAWNHVSKFPMDTLNIIIEEREGSSTMKRNKSGILGYFFK